MEMLQFSENVYNNNKEAIKCQIFTSRMTIFFVSYEIEMSFVYDSYEADVAGKFLL